MKCIKIKVEMIRFIDNKEGLEKLDKRISENFKK
jgi:hypothetical protein